MLDMFHILEQANSGNMHVFFSLLQIYSSFIQVWYQKLTTPQTAFSPAVKETCSCHSCLVPGEGIDSWLGIHLLLHSGSQWLLFIYFIITSPAMSKFKRKLVSTQHRPPISMIRLGATHGGFLQLRIPKAPKCVIVSQESHYSGGPHPTSG